jgi:pilus assembly protein CpaB
MNVRRLLIAMAVAIFISGGLTLWLGRTMHRSAKRSAEKLKYVAASKPLSAGDVLTADNLATVDWPSDLPLQGALIHKEDATGRVVMGAVAAGEPILDRQLGVAGAGLSPRIPNGMRAISLKSNEVVGVAGYLLPGTHVDVLVTLRQSGSQDAVTSTVLQDAQVLTAGQQMQPDPNGKAVRVDEVTLLVSPTDAERVVLASTQGTVHFLLRNGSDRTSQPEPDIHLSALTSAAPPATYVAPSKPTPTPAREHAASPAQPRYSIQMVRGDKESVVTF